MLPLMGSIIPLVRLLMFTVAFVFWPCHPLLLPTILLRLHQILFILSLLDLLYILDSSHHRLTL